MKKRALLKPKSIVRSAGALFFALFVFAGCEDDGGGPGDSVTIAWTRHEPVLEGNKLRAVTFASQKEGWAVGQEGVILHTSNGGKSWSYQSSGTNDNLSDITFFDADTGWAVGEKGSLLRTTNGGSVWSPTQFDTISDDIFSVAFEDGQSGWAVGEKGTILRTTDAGRSWKRLASGTNETLRGAFSRTPSPEGDENNLWLLAVGDAGTVVRIWVDSDFVGQSVDTIDTNDLWAVAFVDSATGWAVGENGAIWATGDGGLTWLDQTGNVSDSVFETLTGVVFTGATTGLVVGSNGTILSTSDGGQTWSVQTSDTSHDLFGITFDGQNNAWAVGNLTILKSTNDGKNWSPNPSGTAPYTTLADITFLNEDLGWAVGYAGTILKITNGGDTWEYQRRGGLIPPAVEWLSDVMFVDSLHGWCVGSSGGAGYPEKGLLLRTTDGGRSWTEETFDMVQWLYGVAFVDTATGWMVGGDWDGALGAIVLKTTDGGLNWAEQTIPTLNRLGAVTFVDSVHGWAVGEKGTILHTLDGDEWTDQSLGWKCTSWEIDTFGVSTCVDSTELVVTLNAIAATDSLHCWMVGINGSIFLYTPQGDTSWVQQTSGTTRELKAVTFLDAATGWAVGAGGVILHTANGGATWSVQPSGTGDDLLGVEFIDRDYGWIVGDYKIEPVTILSTTTGGK